ncbi:MAG: hypothetical protein ACPGES_09070 [Coraliomargarita sp.]
MLTPPDRHKAPSLTFTGIFAALLFIPFAIKLVLTEPYPAVIMPSGSGRMDISQGTYTFTHYRAYGISLTGSREPLNIMDLIKPAHDQYLYVIFNNGFGLIDDSKKTLQLRGTDWTIASYPQAGATPTNQAQYRSALNSTLGKRFEKLLLERVIVLGDLNTRNWLQETIDESTLIEL